MGNRGEDLTGQTFFRLTVLRRATEIKGVGPVWECRCSCGGTHRARTADLQRGGVKSCGCWHREHAVEKCRQLGKKYGPLRQAKYTPSEAAARLAYGQYRRNALQAGREFKLSREQFVALSLAPCFYCGQMDSRQLRRQHGKPAEEIRLVGVDRADNAAGYTPDNAVSCCIECNFSKRSVPLSKWLSWIHRIALHNAQSQNS